MPFIKEERREMINKDQYFSISTTEEGIQPGDRCYYYYKPMVDRWKANPRWTTAHEIYKDVLRVMVEQKFEEFPTDDYIAMKLAWQVFFQLYVMPYELRKREENGDI